MTTMILENLHGTSLELFKQLAIETGVTFSLRPYEKHDAIFQGSNNIKQDNLLAFNHALLSMPIVEGYDDIDIFAREPSVARDIDLSD